MEKEAKKCFSIDYLLKMPHPVKQSHQSDQAYVTPGSPFFMPAPEKDNGQDELSSRQPDSRKRTFREVCNDSTPIVGKEFSSSRCFSLQGIPTSSIVDQYYRLPPFTFHEYMAGNKRRASDTFLRTRGTHVFNQISDSGCRTRSTGDQYTGYHGVHVAEIPDFKKMQERLFSIDNSDLRIGQQEFADDEMIIDDETRPDEQERISGDGINIYLQKTNLWREFNKNGTEMIINRHGRRMFPRISVKVTGLDPMASYDVSLRFSQVDGQRLKFVNGAWYSTQVEDCGSSHSRKYTHPASPKSGAFWMKDSISFSKLKITNSSDTDASKISLHSMYKYLPHIMIEKIAPKNVCEEPSSSTSPRTVADAAFHVTSFIAVTAYQNEKITCLKIRNNPFAKAFREQDKHSYLDLASDSVSLSVMRPTMMDGRLDFNVGLGCMAPQYQRHPQS